MNGASPRSVASSASSNEATAEPPAFQIRLVPRAGWVNDLMLPGEAAQLPSEKRDPVLGRGWNPLVG